MKNTFKGETAEAQHQLFAVPPEHVALSSMSSTGVAVARPARAKAVMMFFTSILKCSVSRRKMLNLVRMNWLRMKSEEFSAFKYLIWRLKI